MGIYLFPIMLLYMVFSPALLVPSINYCTASAGPPRYHSYIKIYMSSNSLHDMVRIYFSSGSLWEYLNMSGDCLLSLSSPQLILTGCSNDLPDSIGIDYGRTATSYNTIYIRWANFPLTGVSFQDSSIRVSAFISGSTIAQGSRYCNAFSSPSYIPLPCNPSIKNKYFRSNSSNTK